MRKEEIETILKRHGIRRGSKSWGEYARAKRIIEDLATSPDDYDRAVAVITEYVEV